MSLLATRVITNAEFEQLPPAIMNLLKTLIRIKAIYSQIIHHRKILHLHYKCN